MLCCLAGSKVGRQHGHVVYVGRDRRAVDNRHAVTPFSKALHDATRPVQMTEGPHQPHNAHPLIVPKVASEVGLGLVARHVPMHVPAICTIQSWQAAAVRGP